MPSQSDRPGLVVALTGGIGSGKTTVSNRLAELGAAVIDTDLIAHELTAPGGAALEAIADEFGSGVFTPDGRLERTALRRVVFESPSARRRLEAILHPRILARMRERLSRVEGPYAVLVVPLLFEAEQTGVADRILVVDVPEAIQIARVKARSGLAEGEIRRILDSQATRSVRLAGADDLIDNSGLLETLLDQVDALHAQYLKLAAAGCT